MRASRSAVVVLAMLAGCAHRTPLELWSEGDEVGACRAATRGRASLDRATYDAAEAFAKHLAARRGLDLSLEVMDASELAATIGASLAGPDGGSLVLLRLVGGADALQPKLEGATGGGRALVSLNPRAVQYRGFDWDASSRILAAYAMVTGPNVPPAEYSLGLALLGIGRAEQDRAQQARQFEDVALRLRAIREGPASLREAHAQLARLMDQGVIFIEKAEELSQAWELRVTTTEHFSEDGDQCFWQELNRIPLPPRDTLLDSIRAEQASRSAPESFR